MANQVQANALLEERQRNLWNSPRFEPWPPRYGLGPITGLPTHPEFLEKSF